MSEPYHPFALDKPASSDEKQRQAVRRLVIHYKRCFTSESGKLVLEDLKKVFQFGRWPADNSSATEEVMRRVCAQGPLYHIQKQLDNTLSPKRKKTPPHENSVYTPS